MFTSTAERQAAKEHDTVSFHALPHAFEREAVHGRTSSPSIEDHRHLNNKGNTLEEETFANGKICEIFSFHEHKISRMSHIKIFCEHKLSRIGARKRFCEHKLSRITKS